MRFVRQLAGDEDRVLETTRRTAAGRVSHTVLLSNRRYCITGIARVFDVSENVVRLWIERLLAGQRHSLDDRPRSGRPLKASAVVQAAIHEDVLKPPSRLAHALAIWIPARLCIDAAVRYWAKVVNVRRSQVPGLQAQPTTAHG